MNDIAALCKNWVCSTHYVDLTARQMAMLAIICDDDGPHHVRHLAVALNAAKPVVTRIANRFVELGFAFRNRDHEDGRHVSIAPTALGRYVRAALAQGGNI